MISIVAYDPTWPERFEAIKQEIDHVLGKLTHSIEHIGSTAVVGLCAKPVIDVLIGLAAERVDDPHLSHAVISLGYDPLGPRALHGRHVFVRRGAGHDANLHVVEAGGSEWRRLLLFRDFLRADADAALRYARLKQRLAAEWSTEDPAYGAGKRSFMSSVQLAAVEWSP